MRAPSLSFTSPTYNAAGQLTAASLAVGPSTQQSMIGLTRTYDLRLRPLSEPDAGQMGTPGTPATATVNVMGTEQSIGGSRTPTQASSTITLSYSGGALVRDGAQSSGVHPHVTQRGNRRESIFFEDGDQEIYRDLPGEQTRKADVEVWAYCLMPNHVHLILNPRQADGLGRAVGEAHRRFTNFINARGRWTGHLFQSRFASVAMDEWHLVSAVCYVSLNPVRARLVTRAEDWPWSSVRAHMNGADDGLVTVRPVLDRVPNFAELLYEPQCSTREDGG
jgi:putative transposase